MASSSDQTAKKTKLWENIREFPPVIDGRIHFVSFLEATNELIILVERLGTIFAPVKYDMQGNIDKVKKHYIHTDASCLLELMLDEHNKGKQNRSRVYCGLTEPSCFLNWLFKK